MGKEGWLPALLASALLVAIPAALAFVGHDSSQISGGTFGNGSYVFPANVTIGGNAFVTGNVGIGTTTPTILLTVNGTPSDTIPLLRYNA